MAGTVFASAYRLRSFARKRAKGFLGTGERHIGCVEMADKREDFSGKESASRTGDRVVAERVEELTWALMDEQVNDDEFRLLETLLLADDNARGSYLGCVQLHADLISHFGAPARETPAKVGGESPIVGLLDSGISHLGLASTEEAAQ